MSESEGFILKAEQFNQEEWCEMFIIVSKTCKDLRVENECLQNQLQQKENIINKLEHHLYQEWLEWRDSECQTIYTAAFEDKAIYDYLQELKGSNDPSYEEMVGFVEKVCKDIKSQPTLHEELEEERKTIAEIVGDFKEVNK